MTEGAEIPSGAQGEIRVDEEIAAATTARANLRRAQENNANPEKSASPVGIATEHRNPKPKMETGPNRPRPLPDRPSGR
jgi:hypothetical protein